MELTQRWNSSMASEGVKRAAGVDRNQQFYPAIGPMNHNNDKHSKMLPRVQLVVGKPWGNQCHLMGLTGHSIGDNYARDMNTDNYLCLVRSWTLEENSLLPLSQTSLISYCIINTYPYAGRQMQFSCLIKEAPSSGRWRPLHKPQLVKMHNATDYMKCPTLTDISATQPLCLRATGHQSKRGRKILRAKKS